VNGRLSIHLSKDGGSSVVVGSGAAQRPSFKQKAVKHQSPLKAPAID
jgi:hypothetical protein